MIKSCAVFLIACCLGLLPGSGHAAVRGAGANAAQTKLKPLKVYILAGQSNMQGHCAISTFGSMASDPKTASLLKEMVDGNGKPVVCKDVWISSVGCQGDAYTDLREQKGNLTAGYGAPFNNIGPEFTFGLTMEKSLHQPILIIKTSWGGRSLMTDFRPPSAGPRVFSDAVKKQWLAQGLDPEKEAARQNDEVCGVYYRHMMEHIKLVLHDIKRVVPTYNPKQGYKLAGFVWFQGFNDYVDGQAYPDQNKQDVYAEYSKLMGDLIRDVRKGLSAPKMPFIVGVMGIGGKTEGQKPPQMYFRQAEVAPTLLPQFKGNIVAVPTSPYWDDDLNQLYDRQGALYDKLSDAFRKHPNFTDAQMTQIRDAALAKEFTPEELERFKNGVSNAPYHYLGSAKIMAQIGRAFGEALLKLSRSH